MLFIMRLAEGPGMGTVSPAVGPLLVLALVLALAFGIFCACRG